MNVVLDVEKGSVHLLGTGSTSNEPYSAVRYYWRCVEIFTMFALDDIRHCPRVVATRAAGWFLRAFIEPKKKKLERANV